MKKGKITVLFICLGNICRSPAANAVLQKMVDDAGLTDRFLIDSAAVGPWHIGDLPDKRMRQAGAQRGWDISHIARQFDASSDFDRFDYIVVMDEENYKNITRQARHEQERNQVIRMADYFEHHPTYSTVPDPYYGGMADFELALDLIEDGCQGLLKQLFTGK